MDCEREKIEGGRGREMMIRRKREWKTDEMDPME